MPTQDRITAGQLAELVGGELLGDPGVEVSGAADLRDAGPTQAAFLASSRYVSYFHATQAGVVFVPERYRTAPGPRTRIVVADPRRAMALALDALAPVALEWGIHPTARVAAGARWEGRVWIGAHAIIGERARLGAECRIEPHATVGSGAVLGKGCTVAAHAHIGDGVVLGARVRVNAGARLGTPGFAFISDGAGHKRIAHRGSLTVGDDVEIGANSTVDRGSVGRTQIGQGTKIDNLVHVAHNTRIGARCLIMAQVGIAGSTDMDDDVQIGGQAGLAGRMHIGRGARIAAQAGVIGDVPAGATVSGYPARDHRSVLRQAAALERLAPLTSKIESTMSGER